MTTIAAAPTSATPTATPAASVAQGIGMPAPALGVPPLVWVCGAVLIGCALGPTRGAVWPGVVALGVVALPFAAISRAGAGWTAAITLLTLGASLWHAAPAPPRPVRWPAGEVIAVRGVVLAWPVTTDRYTRAPVRVIAARTETGWEVAEATLTAFLPTYPPAARGDTVYLSGSARLRAEREGDGVLFARFVSVERVNRQTTPDDVRHAITAGLRGRIEAHVRPPESGLIAGMLLGEKAALDADTGDALNATGTTHLVVVSGWNIAVVAGLFAAIGRGMGGGRRGRLWAGVSLLGIVAYTFAVGAEPPVVRAAIMGAAGLVAPLVGRRADPLVSLALAAAIMAALHPPVVASLSFLFSLAATFGVLIVAPWLQRQMERCAAGRAMPALTAALAVTMAAQLTTEPLAWHVFGRVTLVGAVVNVIVEPLVPCIMAMGAIVAVFGFLPLPLVGDIVGAVAAIPAWLFLRIVRLGAAVPFASVALPQPGLWLTAACYVAPALVVLAIRLRDAWRERKPSARSVAWGTGGFAATLAVVSVVAAFLSG